MRLEILIPFQPLLEINSTLNCVGVKVEIKIKNEGRMSLSNPLIRNQSLTHLNLGYIRQCLYDNSFENQYSTKIYFIFWVSFDIDEFIGKRSWNYSRYSRWLVQNWINHRNQIDDDEGREMNFDFHLTLMNSSVSAVEFTQDLQDGLFKIELITETNWWWRRKRDESFSSSTLY